MTRISKVFTIITIGCLIAGFDLSLNENIIFHSKPIIQNEIQTQNQIQTPVQMTLESLRAKIKATQTQPTTIAALETAVRGEVSRTHKTDEQWLSCLKETSFNYLHTVRNDADAALSYAHYKCDDRN